MIRVLIADDHGILRDGLAQLVDEQSDMEVVATASDGAEAVAKCRDEKPDVALLDLSMPGGDGLTALREIAEVSPDTRSVMLTMHDDADALRACLTAGAAGFLVKHVAAAEIVRAIRDVHAGRSSIRVGLSADTLSRLVGGNTQPQPPTPASLSPREHEVLKLLSYGHTSKEIGALLEISPKSVDSYRTRIYDKLGMRGRAELVRYALEHGILIDENNVT